MGLAKSSDWETRSSALEAGTPEHHPQPFLGPVRKYVQTVVLAGLSSSSFVLSVLIVIVFQLEYGTPFSSTHANWVGSPVILLHERCHVRFIYDMIK
jgi:hypothetical protein